MTTPVTKDGRQSKINRGSITITRSGPGGGGNAYNSRQSVNMSRGSMAPGTFTNIGNTGVTDLKGKRATEKKDLQDLNERFACYIDKVHYLEANCKRLEAENEALRNRKEADLEPIRKAYENELDQARKVIDELSTSKGASEAKLAGLQDEVDSLRDMIATYETQAKDRQKKIESLGNQIGEYEGELQTLRLRVGSLEDEVIKVRELLAKVQNQNKALRCDLDAETAAHIEADCLLQTKTDEVEFLRDLLNEIELCKPEPVQIKGMDQGDFWKSEMKKALREMNEAYDNKIEVMQMDMEAKYTTQLNALKNGNVKDTMAVQRKQDEITKLKGMLSDKNTAYTELAARLAALQAERDELDRKNEELERELDACESKYKAENAQLQDELAAVLAQLQTLMDAKMSLELEIACYKKLLEGEETRVGLRSYVEDALGVQTKGNAQNAFEAALANQSSEGGLFGAFSAASVESAASLKESTGSLTVQRSSKGPIAFKSMDHSGGNIIIENTSSGNRAKSQNLKGWKLQKNSGGRVTTDITLNDFELASGKTFTLWAKGAKDKASEDNEQVADNFSFGVGSCTWKLLDDTNAEKATLNARFIQ